MSLCSTAAVRGALTACGLALMVFGCAESQPQSTVSRELGSGVTSSNGGGMAPANFGSVGSAGVSNPTFDTGSMAFPAPLPQGDFRRARTQ